MPYSSGSTPAYSHLCLNASDRYAWARDGIGFGWTPGRDRVGNGQTDERREGVGETDEVGVEGPVRVPSTRAGPINGLFLLGSFECGVDAICRGAESQKEKLVATIKNLRYLRG